MTLLFHAEASDEVDEAFAHYMRKDDPQLPWDFLAELEHQLKRVQATPQQFPAWRHGTQRALLERFPYQIIFHQDEERIVVYSVSHQHRQPDHWVHRL